MLERAVGRLGKGAGRLIDRATAKISETTAARPEPPTLATTTFATSLAPLALTRLIREFRRAGGPLADDIDLVLPDGLDAGRWARDVKKGRYVTLTNRLVVERWVVDPQEVADGHVRHELKVTKRGAGHEWPDHDYEAQLRGRDDAATAALAAVTSARIDREEYRTGKLHEAEVHWRGTVGGRAVVIDRTFMRSAMRVVGMDDLKLELIDGTIDDEPFELRWDRGWVTGTIAGRPVAVESLSNRPATSGRFADHHVSKENAGAPIAVGPTTFDVEPGYRNDAELIIWDGDATGLDPAVLFVLREACASSGRDWA